MREQLNRGTVPENIEVHCLAGLIKAWFRELPSGVLDGLSPDEVLQCNTEEERVELVKQLNPTQSALLNWAVHLMSDVAQQQESNKMNARNIAMVFAPNMTQVVILNLMKFLFIFCLGHFPDYMFNWWWILDVGSVDSSNARCTSDEPAQDIDRQNPKRT